MPDPIVPLRLPKCQVMLWVKSLLARLIVIVTACPIILPDTVALDDRGISLKRSVCDPVFKVPGDQPPEPEKVAEKLMVLEPLESCGTVMVLSIKWREL